jgi:hypothetical protein
MNVIESSSFLKKRTKKLLILGARVGSKARANKQKVFASFSKKKCFLASIGARS